MKAACEPPGSQAVSQKQTTKAAKMDSEAGRGCASRQKKGCSAFMPVVLNQPNRADRNQ
jgi:hypothetical protein